MGTILKLREEHWGVLLPFLIVLPVAVTLVVLVLAERNARNLY